MSHSTTMLTTRTNKLKRSLYIQQILDLLHSNRPEDLPNKADVLLSIFKELSEYFNLPVSEILEIALSKNEFNQNLKSIRDTLFKRC